LATVTGGQLPLAHTRPEAITAIPVRHWGRWISAAVIIFLVFALLWSLWHNPNVDISYIGQTLFKPFVLQGVVVTIELTVIAMIIGVVGGVLLAVMRLSDNPVLSSVSWGYIWFFRGTPILVQIIFWGFLGSLYPTIFLGVPFTGLVFGSAATGRLYGAFVAAILALGLNEAAYAAELVRAGIISVDKGQNEAAFSLGMSTGLTMRMVVLPQAMRVIIPPMGNETISMLKTTALVSLISGTDLMTRIEQAYAQNFKTIPLLIVASLWYLFLTSIMSVGQHYLEAYYGRGYGAVEAERAEKRGAKRALRREGET
jgi:His/Glu/Gln/Arg/opine family amino acid ABC transporter permease subunit